MNATAKALNAIGMTFDDYEREDFKRRSGKKAAAALRAMGYEKRGFTQMGGSRLSLWAKTTGPNAPLTTSLYSAFECLIVAIANAEK